MKTNIKLLSIIIIIFSFISWIIWAYTFVTLIPQNNTTEKNTKTEKQEIIKENKIVEIKDLENEITKVVKTISPSVVSIIIKKDLLVYRRNPRGFFDKPIWSVKEKVWWWTGFFITTDWKIITNKHVISDKNAIYTVITNSGEEYDAKLLAEDPINDIAVLKIESEKKFTPLKFISEKEKLKLWQFAIAIWNAMAEFQNSVSLWIISWQNRTIEIWNKQLSSLIQTDTAINPWNSWWPLINLNWQVVWINTAILDWTEGIWFAIHTTEEKINYILNSIEKYWEIKRPFIGISYIPVSKWIKEKLWLKTNYWAYIIDEQWAVVQWSNADLAWIEPWDTILKIDNIKLDLNNNLNTFIQNKIPWEELELEIMKKSWEKKKLKIKLGEY